MNARRTLSIIYLLAAATVITISFQNCSGRSGFTNVASSAQQASGPGEGYTGKVYVEVAQSPCPDGSSIKSRIILSSQTSAKLDRENCIDIQPKTLTYQTDYQFDPVNVDNLFYAGRTFVAQTPEGVWQRSLVDLNAIFYSGGKVGVGTDQPLEKLHVNGDMQFAGNAYLGAFGSNVSLANVYAATNMKSVGGQPTQIDPSMPSWATRFGGGTNDDFMIIRMAPGDPWAERYEIVKVMANGNVGLSIKWPTVPTERLDLGGGNIKMGYETMSVTCSGSGTSCAASCSAGKQVLSGGCVLLTGSGSIQSNGPGAGATSWICVYAGASVGNFSASAVCANIR